MRSNTAAMINSALMDKKKYFREYYLAHREKLINRSRLYSARPDVKEKRRLRESEQEYSKDELEYRRVYRINHLEESNEYKKKWNKEKRKTAPEIKLKMYEATKKWRRKSREKINQNAKEWRIKNPEKWKLHHAYHTAIRRSRIKAVTIVPFSYKEILQRDGYNCHICGRRVNKKDLSFDHLIPISKGGSHSRENVAVAHLSCNVKRNAGQLPVQLRLM